MNRLSGLSTNLLQSQARQPLPKSSCLSSGTFSIWALMTEIAILSKEYQGSCKALKLGVEARRAGMKNKREEQQ